MSRIIEEFDKGGKRTIERSYVGENGIPETNFDH